MWRARPDDPRDGDRALPGSHPLFLNVHPNELNEPLPRSVPDDPIFKASSVTM